jgi:hypothetical protein
MTEKMPKAYWGRKNVRTIGYCIYCGARGNGVKLTKEHIIPYSLGSDVYLKDASCIPCAAITKDFEHHVARNIFGQHRIHADIQTRHPEQRPDVLPTHVVRNGIESRLDLSIPDHPYFVVWPVWGPAGILRGVPPSLAFDGLGAHMFYSVPANIRETLGLKDGEIIEIRPQINADAVQFSRMLAKIAYCTAIANEELDGFRVLAIPDLILGKYSCPSYFVGSIQGAPPPPDRTGPFHRVDCEDVWFNGVRLLLAHIRLFARDGVDEHGTPIYTVVFGAPRLPKRKAR